MKRDGRIEKFNPIKIEKVVNTCKDSLDLSLDNFYNKFQIGLKSGIKTSEIQRTLINTANDSAEGGAPITLSTANDEYGTPINRNLVLECKNDGETPTFEPGIYSHD